MEAWHWNPEGTWSDPAGKGYFTGSTSPADMIRHSYGYPLPHRGFTRNEGTETNGFSRMTDGDLNTYWKSNPYRASISVTRSEISARVAFSWRRPKPILPSTVRCGNNA